ncbi:MAG: glycosyltransferase family 10 [Pseudomonadota bacterium]
MMVRWLKVAVSTSALLAVAQRQSGDRDMVDRQNRWTRPHLLRRVARRLGHLLNHYYRRYFSRPVPLASDADADKADIVICCYDDWGNVRLPNVFAETVKMLTPGRSCVWSNVAFVREDYPDPDWHLVMTAIDRDRRPLKITASQNRVIHAICEPPTPFHKAMHTAQGEGSYVLTSDEQIVAEKHSMRKHILSACMCPTWIVGRDYDFLKATSVTEKPKKLSWVCSDYTIMPEHRYRLRFLERLKAQGVDFDHFGRGFREVHDKWDALAPYRYSIAFENAVYDHYVTEKLTDCFVAETMPLYCGSQKVTDFFPAESMVIIDPDDPDIWRIIEDVVNSDRYRKNRDAILEAKRITLDHYNMIARLANFVNGVEEPPSSPETFTIRHIGPDYRHADEYEVTRLLPVPQLVAKAECAESQIMDAAQ